MNFSLGQLSAVVVFNSRGISGNITFTEIPNSPGVRIVSNLQGLRGNITILSLFYGYLIFI